MNNDAAGGIKPKSGDNACVLNRGSGFSKTGKAMGSKTRSGHPATSMNNKWKDAGWGTGGNVNGYSKGNGGGNVNGY